MLVICTGFRDGAWLTWVGVGVAKAAVVLVADAAEVPGTGVPLVMVVTGPARPMQTYTEACRPEQSVPTAG
jgi:hypothetical protein